MKFARSIKKSYLTGMLSVAFFSVTISSVINIFYEYRDFLVDTEKTRAAYVDRQKEMIKDEVDKAVAYIEYMKSQAERRLKENIRTRTNEAIAIASNIYTENSHLKNRPEIEKMIRDALRPIRFNDGRGYYFATDLYGIEQLFADRPELEGKNLIGVQDTQGKFVIQDMINIAKTLKEGFYRYQWTKPNEKGKDFPKIAYIKLFEPLNWFFGTGEYLDDIEADIQDEVLQRIAKIRFGDNGYIFVVSFEGVTLMNDTQRHLIGKNIWDLTDPNGVKVIQEERRAVENPEGGFIHYVWNKPSENKPSPKISFMKGIPEWKWMVGAGVYTDKVEKDISEKRSALFEEMERTIIKIMLIFAALLGFIYFVAKIISNRLNKNLNTFTDFFTEATTKSTKIKPDDIDFAEFKRLANSANHMIEEREHALSLLKQNEQRYKKAQQMGRVGNWEYDIVKDTLWGSDEAKRIFGFNPLKDNFTLREIENCIPDSERVHQALVDLIERDKPYNLEYDIYPKTGFMERTIRSVAEIIRDDSGKPLKVAGVIQDITDAKKAEKDLHESKERYRDLTEFLPLSIFEIDCHGNIIFANKTALDSTGYTKEDIGDGLNMLQAIAPEYHERAINMSQQVMQGGVTEGSEYLIKRRDGSTFSGFINTRPSKGATKGLLGYIFDLTAQKEAENELREREEELRKILDTVQAGIVIIDKQSHTIIDVNPAAAAMIGIPKERIVDKICHNYICPAEKGACPITDLGQAVDKSERTLITSTEKEIPILKTVTPISLKGRDCLLEVFVDLTEKKLAQEQLLQAQKIEAIGTLAGGIAHDFNNILFPMLGFAEMLQEDIASDSPSQNHITEILNAAMRAKALVQQILAYSRQSEQELFPIKLQKAINETLKLLRSSIPTTIDIQQDISAGCGTVIADSTQIHQIIMNLATNAYHAMEQTGGTLKVSLKQITLDAGQNDFPELLPGQYALISVADTGCGIDKDIMDKIFNPYFTTKEVGKGTGLGLSVVQGIVKNYKGDLKICSEIGKGTEIKICLPITEPITSQISMVETVEAHQGNNERILLVDDEVAVVKMEKQILERMGYVVTMRTGSVEALEAFRNKPNSYDLVITDMTMPNMTGALLAQEVKKIRPDIPVILCTGYSDQIDEEKSKIIGIQGYLMKPIIKNELAFVVRKALENTNMISGT